MIKNFQEIHCSMLLQFRTHRKIRYHPNKKLETKNSVVDPDPTYILPDQTNECQQKMITKNISIS